MKVFVVHIYDAADHLHDYYVRGTREEAIDQAAADVVAGRFENLDPDDYLRVTGRVASEVYEEPGVGRHHVRCDTWRAHIDLMPVRLPDDLAVDHAHLKTLYAESRDYVRTLTDERDALVGASRRNVTEIDRLDTEVERMRPVYEAAKLSRQSIPCDAEEMRIRKFHPASCDLVEAVDRALAAETQKTPYR